MYIYISYIFTYIHIYIFTYIGLSKRDRFECAWINMHINKPIQVYKRKFFNVMICFVCSKWNKDLIRREFSVKVLGYKYQHAYSWILVSVSLYLKFTTTIKKIYPWLSSFASDEKYHFMIEVHTIVSSSWNTSNLQNILSCKFIRIWSGISMCKWFTL